jgi:hypothetical protein
MTTSDSKSAASSSTALRSGLSREGCGRRSARIDEPASDEAIAVMQIARDVDSLKDTALAENRYEVIQVRRLWKDQNCPLFISSLR